MLRLRRILDTKGVSVKRCAEMLGISEKSLYNKCAEETEFTYGEVRKLKAMMPEYDMEYVLSREGESA